MGGAVSPTATVRRFPFRLPCARFSDNKFGSTHSFTEQKRRQQWLKKTL
jgi:hypothetical protein